MHQDWIEDGAKLMLVYVQRVLNEALQFGVGFLIGIRVAIALKNNNLTRIIYCVVEDPKHIVTF